MTKSSVTTNRLSTAMAGLIITCIFSALISQQQFSFIVKRFYDTATVVDFPEKGRRELVETREGQGMKGKKQNKLY